MKIAGKDVTNEQAYDLLARDESLASSLEATAEERASFVTYATLRAHHDYLSELQQARGDRR